MEWQLDLSSELFCLVVNDDRTERHLWQNPHETREGLLPAPQWLSEDWIKDMREITPRSVTKEITTLKPHFTKL